MELKTAVENLKQIQRWKQTFPVAWPLEWTIEKDEIFNKSLAVVIEKSELVDKIGGIVPKPYHVMENLIKDDDVVSNRELSRKVHNEARSECISAFAGCVLSKEDILRVIMDINQQEMVENKSPYSIAALRSAQDIRALQLQKIGVGK